MSPVRLALVIAAVGALAHCSAERARECDKFLSAMKPLEEGTPSSEMVDRVRQEVDGVKFEDQPLSIYAKNYSDGLSVLSATLKLQASPEPPDGTDGVIKTKLKEARTDQVDVARYCAQ
jgi:hypothetical protein